jgi:hypothetical protein
VILISPSPEFVAHLPNSKLPDRADFKAYGQNHSLRMPTGAAPSAKANAWQKTSPAGAAPRSETGCQLQACARHQVVRNISCRSLRKRWPSSVGRMICGRGTAALGLCRVELALDGVDAMPVRS